LSINSPALLFYLLQSGLGFKVSVMVVLRVTFSEEYDVDDRKSNAGEGSD